MALKRNLSEAVEDPMALPRGAELLPRPTRSYHNILYSRHVLTEFDK